MKIVCLGDSITYGYGIPRHLSWVSLAQAESKHAMYNAGINGDTTGGMLARLQRDVLEQGPDALMLLGGVNDLNAGCGAGPVQSNVTAIIQQAAAAGIRPMIGTILPVFFRMLPEAWKPTFALSAPEAAYEAYRRWLPVFAGGFQVKLVDFYTPVFEAAKADPAKYYIDGLHPNREGHRLMADVFLEALHG